MKKALLAVLAALLLLAAGCGSDKGEGGDLSKDEKLVAERIAKKFSEEDSATLTKAQAACFSEAFVDGAGIKALREAKLIDADNNVVEDQASATFDKELSGNYADAYLDCVDFAETAAKSYAEADKTIDQAKLTSCLKKDLPDSLMKKVIVATQTGDATSADVTEANKALEACQKSSKK